MVKCVSKNKHYMLEIRHLLKIDSTSCFKYVSHSKFNWEDLSNHLMSIEIYNTVTSKMFV